MARILVEDGAMSSAPGPTATNAFRKTTDLYTSGARTLPQRFFVSPEVFQEEEAKIFSRQWVCVGHESDVAAPGDFFVAEVARESLLIVRDQDRQLRGFFNVCRHRGTRLCEESHGHSKVVQCPYHAWTYGLDGHLLGAPSMDTVPGFARSDYSLHPVALETWEGLIFVSLEEKPTSLSEVFAPLAGKFSHWNLPRLRSARRVDYDVRANWKLIFENYSECYHCSLVHPALSKLSPSDSAENDLSEGPFLGGFMAIAKGESLTLSGKACALPVGDIAAEDHAKVFYYSLFPNVLLSLHPDYVMVHLIRPLAPDRSLVRCDWYFHPDAGTAAQPAFHPEDAIDFWDLTNRQDWHVCELSQQGISSRAYQPGPYSPRESIPAAWDREYLRQLDKP